MTSSFSSRMLSAFVLVVVVSGLAIAAHFVFSVSATWDSEPANNEAHVQNRAGELNVAKAQGDTVKAYFTETPTPQGYFPYGYFFRKFLISANAFEQTGGPFYDGGHGGGTCSINDPATTMLSLDGHVTSLGTGFADRLTLQGTAEDGTQFIREQFAVVREDQGALEITEQSFGFSGIRNESRILDNRSGRGAVQMPVRAIADGSGLLAFDSTTISGAPRPFLLVQHQGAHPPNHRYAPTPYVSFVQQQYRSAPGSSRAGWAVVTFGTKGGVEAIQLLPADGLEQNRALTAKLRAGVRSEFRDERRHPHIAYLAYKVSDGFLTIPEPPFVSLPMCVGGGDECN